VTERRRIQGQTLVFYGDGKGKTSAAFGVALRAVGRGWKVVMIQYTKMGEWPKGEPMGEIHGARRLAPDFEVISTGIGFVNILGDTFTMEEHRAAAQRGLQLYHEKAASGDYDLIRRGVVLPTADEAASLNALFGPVENRSGVNAGTPGPDPTKTEAQLGLRSAEQPHGRERVDLRGGFDVAHAERLVGRVDGIVTGTDAERRGPEVSACKEASTPSCERAQP